MVTVSTTIIAFGATGDAQELLALHDEMRHAADAYGEPLWQAVGTIAGCHATAHDQACLIGLRLFEDERPSGLILPLGNRQERTRLCSGSHCATTNTSVAPGRAGNTLPTWIFLIVWQDTFGAAVAAVIDEVVGVPSSAVGAHLDKPRPDVMRRATNRDGVIDRADRLGNQVVSSKSPGTLVRSGADLPARVNRKYREHYRYSEENEQQFLLHGAADVRVAQCDFVLSDLSHLGFCAETRRNLGSFR